MRSSRVRSRIDRRAARRGERGQSALARVERPVRRCQPPGGSSLRSPARPCGAPVSDLGLIGAVLVGVSEAKALSLAWNVPFVGVNHLEGHLFAALLDHAELPWPISD